MTSICQYVYPSTTGTWYQVVPVSKFNFMGHTSTLSVCITVYIYFKPNMTCADDDTLAYTRSSNEVNNDNAINVLLRKSTQCKYLSTLEQLHLLPQYSNVTIVDLGSCALSSLPVQMPQALPNIKILFLSNNNFVEMPPIISNFTNLEMIAFKGNRMHTSGVFLTKQTTPLDHINE